ncbi:AAA family ATPase [Bradyrhizobium ottawaense]|uniref:AAA family ATPase n=1 Tax=Bradyrhizobium ottawaense TaxID=931866 RepID=UPI001BAA65E4|nr:AAA family ATPase [Bradyrhizobium ottawaense]MBR1325705.1 AAA family ATPase [Bradyrhizobium ottawaense]
MNRGVRLSFMRVDAFRGIRDSIELDLSSPITLVFAPNGTGKTTLCEAAEWLLTGQVDRLREGKDFSPAVLKSKFVVGNRQPSVSADIMVGDEKRSLVRAVQGGSQQDANIARLGEPMQLIGPHDLLSFLAPSAASQEAHHLRAINLRQRWLRGTRFLTAEALAALVDSDPETVERRTQIFADLLGIRHLLDAEKLCDQFITDLGARERRLAQTVTSHDSEIDSLTAALVSSSISTTSALAEVEAATEKLKIGPRNHSSVHDRIEALSAEHGRRERRLESRRSSIEAVAAEWTTRIQTEKMIATLGSREVELINRLNSLDRSVETATAASTNAKASLGQQSERARELMTARDQIGPLISSLLEALTAANGHPLLNAPTLGALMKAVPESLWTADEQSRRGLELRAALQDIPTGLSEDRQLGVLRTQLQGLAPELCSAETLATLRAEVDRLDAVAVEARRKLDAALDPLSRLQAAARDLLIHSHDETVSECPLCSHDWGSAAELRAAISATLESAPELAGIVQSNATSAAEAASLYRSRLDDALRRNNQGVRLQADIQALETSISRRREGLRRLGISEGGPAPALEAMRQRLSVGVALSNLVRERNRYAAKEIASLLSDDIAIRGLSDAFGARLAARNEAIQLDLKDSAKAAEEAANELDRLRVERATAWELLGACREELARLRAERARVQALWDQVAPNLEWTDAALSKVRNEVVTETALLAEIADHIAAAQAAWSGQVRRARRDELRTAVEPMRARLEHMGARMGAAGRAKAAFHQTYNDVSKRQIEDLGRVVNPLFARMHANRIVDKIKVGHSDEPLRWFADAGNQEMDPGKDFSQGQRQDLALAVFLGRARSLGGTFFLDEPVTHLDDLNRVGLLDVFRATAMESSSAMNLVLTTASKALARHLIEKFSSAGAVETPAGKRVPLRVVELDGNGRTGVVMRNVYPAER